MEPQPRYPFAPRERKKRKRKEKKSAMKFRYSMRHWQTLMPCVYVFSKRVGLNLEVTVGDDHGRAKDLMESTSRVFFFNYVVWNVLLVMIQNCLCHFGACYAYSYKIIWSKMVCLCYFEICQPFNAWAHTKWSISSQRAKSSISKPLLEIFLPQDVWFRLWYIFWLLELCRRFIL